MVPGHIARVKEHGGIGLASLTGDHGFDSKNNAEALAKEEIENYLCPRTIDELRNRLGEEEFQKHQARHAQTEARIAILTRNFTGSPARKWGHPNKERLCAWAILAHNLWVLARLTRLQESPARAA